MLQIDKCLVEYIGKNVYRIRPEALDNKFYIELTGAAVTVELKIDRPHRLTFLAAHHTTSTPGTDSTDSLSLTLKRIMESGIKHILFEDQAVIVADVNALLGERYERPPSTYEIIANSTITDRLYWELYVQLLGD